MKTSIVPASRGLVRGLLRRQIVQVHLPVDRDCLEAEVPNPVYADSPFATRDAKYGVRGRVHVGLNQHGAVSAMRANMGLRPGEFRFVCPFVDGGDTVLRERHVGTWHIEGGAGQIAFTETWAIAGYRSADAPAPSREQLVAEAPREAVLYAADGDDPRAPWGRSPWFGRAHMPIDYVRLYAVVRGVKLRRFDTLTPTDIAESQGLEDATPPGNIAAFARRWSAQHGRSPAGPRWVWTLHIAPMDAPTVRSWR